MVEFFTQQALNSFMEFLSEIQKFNALLSAQLWGEGQNYVGMKSAACSRPRKMQWLNKKNALVDVDRVLKFALFYLVDVNLLH